MWPGARTACCLLGRGGGGPHRACFVQSCFLLLAAIPVHACVQFNCRAKGKGWRLDYWLASKGLMPRVYDSWLLPDVMGSDHVPIGLTLRQ